MRSAVILLLACLGLAACAGAGPPLHSPYEASHRYGYRERAIAPDRYEVQYIGPVRYLPSHPGNRPAAIDEAVRVSGELALLRAAELAEENGYAHFAVERRESDVDIRHVREIEEPPFYHYPYYRYPYWHPYYYPYGFPPYAYPVYVREYSIGRAIVTIEAQFLSEPRESSFAVDETLRRLRARYLEPRDGRRRGQ